jgi:hypothetical protein
MLQSKTITFAIHGDVFRPGDPDPEKKIEPELFGDAFVGEVICRIPTATERLLVIPSELEALLKASGFKEPPDAPLTAWEFANAMVFFKHLAPERPAWLRDDAAGTGKGLAAIRHAHQKVLGLIDQGNGSSAGAGLTSSGDS